MDLHVTRDRDKIILEFGPKATGFFNLLVSNSREEVMWDLKPATVEVATIIDANMSGVRLTEEDAAAAIQSLTELGEVQRSEYPRVSRIVYGEVPDGYHETAKARPLVSGEKYCILVFGEELAPVGEFFMA